jgi:GMP synthase-like glutamine amidotransferase
LGRGEQACSVARDPKRSHPYRSYDVQAGEPPADPAECPAYVIIGFPAGVHDDLPWIPPLLDFRRKVRGKAKLVDIGFGHQAMAKAFGGEVAPGLGGRHAPP